LLVAQARAAAQHQRRQVARISERVYSKQVLPLLTVLMVFEKRLLGR